MTPIWDKSEAQDVSMYDDTPYKGPLAAFGKLMVEDGRKGHSPEHIGRWVSPSLMGLSVHTCIWVCTCTIYTVDELSICQHALEKGAIC